MQASVLAFSRKIASWALLLLTISALSSVAQAQSAADFTVEVQVANQSNKERGSAYRLAFDRVLRRQVETRIRIEPFQREELMNDPSLFVQSFRYRGFNPDTDQSKLATSSVRGGAAPAAVISVAFSPDLAAIIQQRLIPVAEEPQVATVAPVIALVAVEQQGSQFIIGGDRGKKFQARATQLAAANNLQLQFPTITTEDLELISAADIFNGDIERINSFVSRFEGNELLTGALYRLSPTAWQSDWSYTGQGQAAQSFGLTTATLDEALVAAMTQISPGGGYLSSNYDDSSVGGFTPAGVAIRIQNIRSLADYDKVLSMLRDLDSEVVTESLEFESMVFRASEQGAQRVRNSLLSNRNFESVNTDQFGGELSFRYVAR